MFRVVVLDTPGTSNVVRSIAIVQPGKKALGNSTSMCGQSIASMTRGAHCGHAQERRLVTLPQLVERGARFTTGDTRHTATAGSHASEHAHPPAQAVHGNLTC
eukprot:m.323169 g.323169  ORF g.323169 m.323169 type:complete len:103 (+) comp27621_c0_seq14:389-697(+)